MARVTHVRVVMNHEGAKALLTSDAVYLELVRRADLIASAAGGAPDFEVIPTVGSARARAIVVTATVAGMLAEARERRLSNALSAGRG